MKKQPNILFLMSDQHHAGSMSFCGHPTVRTPNLDRLAATGVHFNRAYCNNPICSPSRLCFVTGQYAHTHRLLGNHNFELAEGNSHTLGATLRRHGYQTALIGKAHMVRQWDEEAYEYIRYVDLCDAQRHDPRTCHYYQYLVDHGLADLYEDGALPPDHETMRKGCAIAKLPYAHTNEHYTGEQSLAFLKSRDRGRPFFLHMSFERPHPHWMPSPEHADLYDPTRIRLGEDAVDWWENQWAGRPAFIRQLVRESMRHWGLPDLKKMLAYHFALVTVIDMEMGRVLDWLRQSGEANHTIIVYAADHGDFAGDHGICNKNIGIYESIHRIPFILAYPGGPQNVQHDGIIESIDLYPTLCDLAQIPVPAGVEGCSVVPLAEGRADGKDLALCEWDFVPPQRRINAIRTSRYRLVYYGHELGGELYDHQNDPHELRNLWDAPSWQVIRLELLEYLLDRINLYARRTDFETDAAKDRRDQDGPTYLIHKRLGQWSQIAARLGLTNTLETRKGAVSGECL